MDVIKGLAMGLMTLVFGIGCGGAEEEIEADPVRGEAVRLQPQATLNTPRVCLEGEAEAITLKIENKSTTEVLRVWIHTVDVSRGGSDFRTLKRVLHIGPRVTIYPEEGEYSIGRDIQSIKVYTERTDLRRPVAGPIGASIWSESCAPEETVIPGGV